tara:strand:+ start:9130 stop:9294 length:165 start_codon:yes stop_codon:yes gene_type:complete
MTSIVISLSFVDILGLAIATIKQIREATKRSLNKPILKEPYLPKKNFNCFVLDT